MRRLYFPCYFGEKDHIISSIWYLFYKNTKNHLGVFVYTTLFPFPFFSFLFFFFFALFAPHHISWWEVLMEERLAESKLIFLDAIDILIWWWGIGSHPYLLPKSSTLFILIIQFPSSYRVRVTKFSFFILVVFLHSLQEL